MAMVAPLGCDDLPTRNSVHNWPTVSPIQTGSCQYSLKDARLWHTTEWHLEVEVRAVNIGVEEAYCSFSARAMTSSNTALTDKVKAGEDLAPNAEWERISHAREASTTGLSHGAAEGAWVYMELSDGYWPIATTAPVQVEPDRVRRPE